MLEYMGRVYNAPKKPKFDPVYPDKKVEYVPQDQCGHPHNYLNGWKCINCGAIKPKSEDPKK